VEHSLVAPAGEGRHDTRESESRLQQSLTLRAQDAANFNAWFAAYLSGNKRGEQVAERRFRA
jgi:hypothetical protein